MAEAKPNAAHLAISRLQQGYSGEVYILTQNMDTLHEKAGSENVYHIHGQINKIRCSHCHNIWETWNDITPDMPCPFCRAEKSLRPERQEKFLPLLVLSGKLGKTAPKRLLLIWNHRPTAFVLTVWF